MAKGARGGRRAGRGKYEALPLSTRLFGGRNASMEDRKKKREIVTRFINEAEAGNSYKTGVGIGSAAESFEVVSYSRSPNKLGIRSGNRTVAMSRANVERYIANGATLRKRRNARTL